MADNTAMSRLQERLATAAGRKSRPVIADRASEIATAAWGPAAPFIDDTWLRTLETRLVNPPGDGKAFRAVLAALDIPLVEALQLLDYWGDLRFKGSRLDMLVEIARSLGIQARVKSHRGTTVVLEVR